MTREEYVRICSTCNNKGFNPQLGIVCGLTKELPAFENECEQYDENEELQQKVQLQTSSSEDELRSAQNDMAYGMLWCMGGLVLTVMDFGYIFWGAIVFGGIQFFRGLIDYNSSKK